MKLQLWATTLLLFGLQTACVSGDSIEYVEGTIDEYYRLHWEPFVKENKKEHNKKRFQRRELKPVPCTKRVLNSHLPEECEERKSKKKRRKRRF